MEETPKKIKVVDGDGTDLEISPVYDHLTVGKPQTKENQKEKKIIIPEEKNANKK